MAGPHSLAVVLVGAAVAGLGAAAQPGQLVQLTGPGACVSQLVTEGICADARALNGPDALAVSADGRSVYAASSGVAPNVSGNPGSIAVFARNAASGRITQPAGPAGCVGDAEDACGEARGIQGTSAVAVAADGRYVYATGSASGSVAWFARSASGGLTQPPGSGGCIAADSAEGCDLGSGLRRAADLAISRDGANVYVASFGSGAVAAFARDGRAGQLRQLAGDAACIAEQDGETEGDDENGVPVESCRAGRGLVGALAVSVSPDGKHVYVLGRDSLAVFRRGPGGGLTQPPGAQGCLSVEGRGGSCALVPQIGNALDLAISPDGLTLYATSYTPGAIVVLRRDPSTGSLGRVTALSSAGLQGLAGLAITPNGDGLYAVSPFQDAVLAFRRNADGGIRQLPGAAGCVSDVEAADSCPHGEVLSRASAVAVSPDGRHLYVSSVEPIGLGCACGRELGSLSAFARTPASLSLERPTAVAPVQAGRPFTIAAPVRTSSSSVRVSCTATAAGRALRVTGRYRDGAAACSGVVPKSASRGRLVGTLSVRADAVVRTANFSFPVRPAA